MTRLYDCTAGSVRINGVDVRDIKTDSLRSAVAVVPQDTVLFNDTILQNIRCAGCVWERWAVLSLCKATHAHALTPSFLPCFAAPPPT